MMEEWRYIVWTNRAYSVSNYGRVKSNARIVPVKNQADRHIQERVLKQGNHTCGYKCVCLKVNGKRIMCLVHRLVAEAFLENYDKNMTIDHIDGNKHNNCVSNLECVTISENIKRAYQNHLNYENDNRKKTHKENGKYIQEKYGKKICQMDLNNHVLRTFKSLNEVHRILNFHIQCIRNAANHHTISYGYKWKWIYEV